MTTFFSSYFGCLFVFSNLKKKDFFYLRPTHKVYFFFGEIKKNVKNKQILQRRTEFDEI